MLMGEGRIVPEKVKYHTGYNSGRVSQEKKKGPQKIRSQGKKTT